MFDAVTQADLTLLIQMRGRIKKNGIQTYHLILIFLRRMSVGPFTRPSTKFPLIYPAQCSSPFLAWLPDVEAYFESENIPYIA